MSVVWSALLWDPIVPLILKLAELQRLLRIFTRILFDIVALVRDTLLYEVLEVY